MNIFIVLSGSLACLIGSVVILGWFLHLPLLIKLHPALNSLKFNTALGFVLAGSSLILFPFYRRVCVFPAILTGILGLITLAEYVTGKTFFIDQFFFYDYLTDPTQFPGRMAPQTAVAFLSFATGIMLAVARKGVTLIMANFCGAFLVVLGVTALFGFILHIPFAFTWGSYNAMALHTAVGFMVLGVGLLLASANHYFPFILTCLLGFTLSLQVFYGMGHVEDAAAASHFTTDAKDRIKTIQKQFLVNHQIVQALGAFFESSNEVSRQEFARFANIILENEEGKSEALEWIPRVPASQKEAVVAQAQAEGVTDFQLRELAANNQRVPVQERAEYYPVLYKEPHRPTDDILGVDFYSSPERFDVMSRACTANSVTATLPVRLLSGQVQGHHQYGYLMFYPIFEETAGAKLDCAHAKGFAVGVFEIKSLLDYALKTYNDAGIDLYLYNTARERESFYNYVSSKRASTDSPGGLAWNQVIEDRKTLRYAEDFTDADQAYRIVAVPTSMYIDQYKTSLPGVLFVLVNLFTVVLALYVLSRIRRTAIIEQLVEERTIQLKAAQQEAMEAAQVKSEFTSMVSHELRTPLTVIKESVAIVYDETAGAINADQKDFLETAKRNVDRLARLINDVLDYQKLESQFMEFRMEPGSINAVVEEVGKGFKTVLEQKNIRLEFYLDPALPQVVFDKDKITQVLTNLMSNAMKFTGAGKAITLSTAMAGDNAIRVAVKDQGIGIKAEDLDKLFKSFSQISTGTGRQTGGTGLGLALSRKIIEYHKGKIEVTSVFGQGSEFYFILPIRDRRGSV